jgi:hypothetical protein
VRLVGLGVSNLVERGRQLMLGETNGQDRLAEVMTSIRERFGDGVVRRAAELQRRERTLRDGE